MESNILSSINKDLNVRFLNNRHPVELLFFREFMEYLRCIHSNAIKCSPYILDEEYCIVSYLCLYLWTGATSKMKMFSLESFV